MNFLALKDTLQPTLMVLLGYQFSLCEDQYLDIVGLPIGLQKMPNVLSDGCQAHTGFRIMAEEQRDNG